MTDTGPPVPADGPAAQRSDALPDTPPHAAPDTDPDTTDPARRDAHNIAHRDAVLAWDASSTRATTRAARSPAGTGAR